MIGQLSLFMPVVTCHRKSDRIVMHKRVSAAERALDAPLHPRESALNFLAAPARSRAFLLFRNSPVRFEEKIRIYIYIHIFFTQVQTKSLILSNKKKNWKGNFNCGLLNLFFFFFCFYRLANRRARKKKLHAFV